MTSCTVTLSVSGGLALTIPSPSGRERTIDIPWTEGGMDALRQILRAQKNAEARHDLTIGAPASPSAYQIERFLVERSATQQAKRTQAADEILTILDLELDL